MSDQRHSPEAGRSDSSRRVNVRVVVAVWFILGLSLGFVFGRVVPA